MWCFCSDSENSVVAVSPGVQPIHGASAGTRHSLLLTKDGQVRVRGEEGMEGGVKREIKGERENDRGRGEDKGNAHVPNTECQGKIGLVRGCVPTVRTPFPTLFIGLLHGQQFLRSAWSGGRI